MDIHSPISHKNTRSRSFFHRSAEEVAPDLLGDHLLHRRKDHISGGMIIETEAYVSDEDDANHAVQSGRTDRNQSMFGKPGQAYVYIIYGMYPCLNVVCNEKGVPEAVLIRAIRPDMGKKEMRERRSAQRTTPLPEKDIANGPGKLCMALRINREHDGHSLVEEGGICICEGEDIPEDRVEETPRIGVEYAEHASDWPLRFVVPEYYQG